jgi:hypothetical protein
MTNIPPAGTFHIETAGGDAVEARPDQQHED